MNCIEAYYFFLKPELGSLVITLKLYRDYMH